MSILFAQPTELYLEISPEIQKNAWQENQFYSHQSNNWRAYLNQICLDTFVAYLREEYTCKAEIWQEKQLASIWEVVNGSAIRVESQKIILIPSEAIDDDELEVSQEWIDIPSWMGDYYLAIQVNLEQNYLRIWGYATHKQLKNQASYDATDRTYSLSGDDLINDFSVLWVARERDHQEFTRETIPPLQGISVKQAENLLKRLGNPQMIFPRLSIPFALWGSLIENNHWRYQLTNLRQGKEENKMKVNLSRWLENLFDNNWQSPESLNLKFAVTRRDTSPTPEVKRAKFINIDSIDNGQPVVLFLMVTMESEGRMAISTQLYPHSENRYLPPGIQLSLLSEDGEILKTCQARNNDNCILIPRFICDSGYTFQIKVELNDFSITENFEV